MVKEEEIRKILCSEMERDAITIQRIIDSFNPQKSLEIVDYCGVKAAIVKDISLIEENPKATLVLVNKIYKETGYKFQDVRCINDEQCLLMIKDLGEKLGKSISIGKENLYLAVLVFDDR